VKLSILFLLVACGGAVAPASAAVTVTTPASTETAPPATVAASASATPPPAATDKRPTEIAGTSVRFAGGDGSSVANAILIKGAHGEMDGTSSEYQYLALLYGPQNTAWKLDQQSLLSNSGKRFDAMAIVLADGTKKTVYFDISEYFGKL
jgi:hypothetical protein